MMGFEKIIVVDDDPIIRRMLFTHFQAKNIPTLAVAGVQQALEEYRKDPCDLMVVDLQLPDGNGIDLIRAVRQLEGRSEFIIMTGFGTIESAVEAMKSGASNYLLKPFNQSQMDVALAQILEQKKLREQNDYLRECLDEESAGDHLPSSPGMAKVYEVVKRAAPTQASVLIQGESGTGKEMIARLLHQHSPRAREPYIKVNCAAIAGNLLESEFFGHEKGAFTGAVSRRAGRFELANNGTLLLDEVTEISPGLQSKLLRVLQEQEFERVGGSRTIKVNVRILATTNRDLSRAVDSGEFRRDLYFRLNVVPLKIPPLRERQEDVEPLLQGFLQKYAARYGKPAPAVSPLALQQLVRYPWPGNVRELQNVVERAVILADAGRELQFSDFIPAPPASSDAVLDPSGGFPTIAAMERRLIDLALRKTNGNRKQAAKLLDIHVRTLRNKLKEPLEEGEEGPDLLEAADHP
jgi:DNA-binding NtrC family response regulator